MTPNLTLFNSDELEAPAWLDNDFFTKVLVHSEKTDNIKIKNLKISPATAKNDHYASIMFRAVLDFEANGAEKSKSLVLKAMPEIDGRKKDMFSESYIFETEIYMYDKIVPEFKRILKSIGEDITIGPPCVYHCLSPKKVIVFEDILPLGYEMRRNTEYNLHELKAAYEKLAKWHAVSYKLLNEKPELFECLRHGMLNMKSFYNGVQLKASINYFIEMLDEYDDLRQYKPYFEALKKKDLIMSSVASFNEYRDNKQSENYYVLCHGDFHSRNMMFKQNSKDGSLEDVMLLDFQICYVGPMVNDLIYPIFMLLSKEQRLNNLDELIFNYFEKFLETLRKIDFQGPMPKIVELRKQMFRNKNYEFFLLTAFLPAWLGFSDNDFESAKLQDSDYRRKLFHKERYIAEVRAILPKYLHLGYFEE